MLTQARRRIAQPIVGIAEPHRRPHNTDPSLGGMVGPREHVHCGEVFVRRQLGKRVDRPAWNVGRLQLVEPERGRLIANAFGDQRVELGDVAAPGLRVGEARVPGKLRSPSDMEEILGNSDRVAVMHEGKSARKAVEELMTRELKAETEW